MTTREHQTRTEQDTQRLAAELASDLRAGDVVALDGPLGAGKTAFVRGLAQGLGLDPALVSSPTFIICQEYGEGDDTPSLVHIDAYRLKDADDLEAVGWDELRERTDAVLAIEWSERVAEALPVDAVRVTLEYQPGEDGAPNGRLIVIERGQVDVRPCPSCGVSVTTAGAQYPFCSSRCRMADLGAWFSESHRIERPIEERDLDG